MATKTPGRRPAAKKSRRKDGFVFAPSGLDALLFDYLYNQIPEGKRRDQMKRLMLLGIIQELGLSLNNETFRKHVPSRPLELMNTEKAIDFSSNFISGLHPTSKSNESSINVYDNLDDLSGSHISQPNVDTFRKLDGNRVDNEDRFSQSTPIPSGKFDSKQSGSDQTGLSVVALMGFKG